jgi:hypothetical protein
MASMTEDQFLRKYHDYQTQDRNEALLEAMKVNKEASGFTVEPVELQGLGFCLMLSKAKKFLQDTGII